MVHLEPVNTLNRVQVWGFTFLLSLSACATPPGSVAVKKSAKFVGPQVQAPVYNEGDWWRIKTERRLVSGVTVTGLCRAEFLEYLIKIEDGRRKVFGIDGDQFERIRCPSILLTVLGRTRSKNNLKFPMQVGLSWSGRFYFQIGGRGRWVDPQYKVESWEMIKTPKGEFQAFKIVMSFSALVERVTTYYYAPKVKAVVFFREEAGEFKRTSTLVDFQVSD